MARAIGRPVIGIDFSPAMLAQCRSCATEAGVELDLRELSLAEPAALIYCPFRSLQHLPSWAGRRRADGVRRQDPVPHTIRFAIGGNRVDIVLDDGSTSSSWWATKNEWLGLLDVAGLELEALYGGFAGEPFTEDSREYVFVARRKPV